MRALFVLVCLFLVLIAIPGVIGVQEELGRCEVNNNCIIGEFVYSDSYAPYTTQICTINITYPNSTMAVVNANMHNNTDGWHNYTYTPPLEGFYKAEMFCNASGDVGRIDKSFIAISATITKLQESREAEYWVEMTDVGEVLATNNYMAQVFVFNSSGYMVNASSTPRITLYDPTLNKIVDAVSMVRMEDGWYNYSYTTSSGQTAGVWSAVVNTSLPNGDNVITYDYWELETNPAQVSITVTDNTITDIACQITITNEGSSAQEYQYRYWVTDVQTGQYDDGTALDSGSGAKLISAGESWSTTPTMTLVNTGTHWCKTEVFYGTEKSGASEQFTAVEAEAVSEAEQVGGGGDVTPISPGVKDLEFVPEFLVNRGVLEHTNITIRNTGSAVLSGLYLTLEGINPAWFSVTPLSVDLGIGQEVQFNVTFNVPQSAATGKYEFNYTAVSGIFEKVYKGALVVVMGTREALMIEMESLRGEIQDLRYSLDYAKRWGVNVSDYENDINTLLDLVGEKLGDAQAALEQDMEEDARVYMDDAERYMDDAKIKMLGMGVEIRKYPSEELWYTTLLYYLLGMTWIAMGIILWVLFKRKKLTWTELKSKWGRGSLKK